MPFARAQAILKRILPEPVFETIYAKTCIGYVKYRKIADTVYYLTPRLDIDDARRAMMIRTIRPYTMVGRDGLLATYDCMQKAEQAKLSGCLVECGVARGGCSALMALVSRDCGSNRVSWLFDSFEGLPAKTIEDGNPRISNGTDRHTDRLSEGYCLGTLDEVEELFYRTLMFQKDNVRMVKGWFQDTLPQYREKVGDIAVLRIDGDWFESTKCCLENLYDNVVDDGYVILDDYALVGCRKAVDEFLASRGVSPEMTLDGRGGAWFKKESAEKII